jgi:hypothetical protein
MLQQEDGDEQAAREQDHARKQTEKKQTERVHAEALRGSEALPIAEMGPPGAWAIPSLGGDVSAGLGRPANRPFDGSDVAMLCGKGRAGYLEGPLGLILLFL